ncbi:hypothetical protein PILCRDRAFT_826814 [Piloderma croceum F 1598]|uniref:CRAL-TRIO domain-containing protein n=1 Tax=Piloderma croceum (strain F 1598) TaxID=765440 RepID=A0A0C3F7U9_PILCF|nr:hypothetical protein PILCRDRAFT_826814 [Piloderma croceum F 1598]
MDIRSLLQANNDKLLRLYKENLDITLALQATLIEDVLPHVRDELQLDADIVDWANEWLEDTASIFQFLRRHKFTRSFAMESIRQNLVWRINTIHPSIEEPPLGILHCLPSPVSDPFGRPIIVLKVSALAAEHSTDNFKHLLMPTIDHLQAHLKELNASQKRTETPILQYIVLLDLADVPIQHVDVKLIAWSMRDVIPRFPGMIAAVFMLNYSWTHSGLWTVAKRVLPAAALSRIFFPSKKELEEYFTPSCLPKEYGGNLPRLQDLGDPLRLNNPLEKGFSHSPSTPVPSQPCPQWPTRISPTSSRNPFFGYPTFSSSSKATPSFQPGRRRLRDLICTLAKMWWGRWRTHVSVLLWLVLALASARIWVKRGGLAKVRRGMGRTLVGSKDLWVTGL